MKYKPGDILTLRSNLKEIKVWRNLELISDNGIIGTLKQSQCATVIFSYSGDNRIIYIIAPCGIGWVYGSNVELVK